MRLVITIDAPDGASVYVNKDDATRLVPSLEPQYVPPFADELIPLPDQAIPIPGDVNLQPGYAEGAAIAQPTQFRRAATGVSGPAFCPVHHEPWKWVAPGVSKGSGKAYEGFWACQTRNCDQRPPRGYVA